MRDFISITRSTACPWMCIGHYKCIFRCSGLFSSVLRIRINLTRPDPGLHLGLMTLMWKIQSLFISKCTMLYFFMKDSIPGEAFNSPKRVFSSEQEIALFFSRFYSWIYSCLPLDEDSSPNLDSQHFFTLLYEEICRPWLRNHNNLFQIRNQ